MSYTQAILPPPCSTQETNLNMKKNIGDFKPRFPSLSSHAYEKIDSTVTQSKKRQKRFLDLKLKHQKFREDRSNANLHNESIGNPGDVDFQRLINVWRKKHCFEIQVSDYNLLLERQKRQTPNIFTVFVRKRPVSAQEKENKDHDVISVPKIDAVVIHSPKILVDGITKVLANQRFLFDGVFNEYVQNDVVFSSVCKPLLDKVYFNQENACCFAFGQTGSGKTYTIKGIENRIIAGLFDMIGKNEIEQKTTVIISYYELYGQFILDLLDNKKEVHVREDSDGIVQVQGIKKVEVSNVETFQKIIEKAKKLRTTKRTQMNKNSSRSHSVLDIAIKMRNAVKKQGSKMPPPIRKTDTMKSSPLKSLRKNVCHFMLIDLAGSERARDRKRHDSSLQKESGSINTSLLALKECIRSLSKKKKHIPYRSSQLTMVLKNVLTKRHVHVSVIATMAPTASNHDHTINTLKYATLLRTGKYVKNEQIFCVDNDEWDLASPYAVVNDQSEKLALLHKKIKNKTTTTTWDNSNAEMPPVSPASANATPFSPPPKSLSRSIKQQQRSMISMINKSPVICIVRVRPLMQNERETSCVEVVSKTKLNLNFEQKKYHLKKNKARVETGHAFCFDSVLDENASQEKMYNVTAHLLMEKILLGYNVTIFAYGQTGAGKTHTMVGTPKKPGIILQITHEILQSTRTTQTWIEASLVEIYNEKIKDLWRNTKNVNSAKRNNSYKKPTILELPGEIVLEHAQKVRVNEVTTLVPILWKGLNSRKRGSTKMNARSSRSHVMLVLYLHTKRGVSKVNLTDLAGSERQAKTGATGRHLKEAVSINQSLSALGNVILALTSKQMGSHIPYRSSVLTRLLQDSLGGNAYTMLIANVSPANSSYYQTLSTLRFASRIKNLKSSTMKPVTVRPTLQIVEAKNKYLEARVKALENKVFNLNTKLSAMRYCRFCGNDKTFELVADDGKFSSATKQAEVQSIERVSGLEVFRRSLSDYDDEKVNGSNS